MNAQVKRKQKSISYTPVDAAPRPTSMADAFLIMGAMSDCGITTIDAGRVYLTIAVKGPRNVSDLARDLGLPMSTTSRILWELNQRGLVRYVAEKSDRRMKVVELV